MFGGELTISAACGCPTISHRSRKCCCDADRSVSSILRYLATNSAAFIARRVRRRVAASPPGGTISRAKADPVAANARRSHPAGQCSSRGRSTGRRSPHHLQRQHQPPVIQQVASRITHAATSDASAIAFRHSSPLSRMGSRAPFGWRGRGLPARQPPSQPVH